MVEKHETYEILVLSLKKTLCWYSYLHWKLWYARDLIGIKKKNWWYPKKIVIPWEKKYRDSYMINAISCESDIKKEIKTNEMFKVKGNIRGVQILLFVKKMKCLISVRSDVQISLLDFNYLITC